MNSFESSPNQLLLFPAIDDGRLRQVIEVAGSMKVINARDVKQASEMIEDRKSVV